MAVASKGIGAVVSPPNVRVNVPPVGDPVSAIFWKMFGLSTGVTNFCVYPSIVTWPVIGGRAVAASIVQTWLVRSKLTTPGMFLGTRSKAIVTGTGLASASVMAWRSVSGSGTSGVGATGVSEVDVTSIGGTV